MKERRDTEPSWAAPAAQGLYDPQHEHDACGVGFVVDLKGRKSHDIVQQGIQILFNLKHRGACGCETNTGDGAGILLQMPHDFFVEEADKLNIKLPAPGRYGVGVVFLPGDRASREACERLFEQIVREEGQELLGWRNVPTDNSSLGPTARASQPIIRQIFIGQRGSGLDAADQMPALDDLNFERKLYVIRPRCAMRRARRASPARTSTSPACRAARSSTRACSTPSRCGEFYPDLRATRVESALALVHSRFCTNTFPNWARAHPYRLIAHNGEINTLRGNVNWMHARESMLASELFGDDIKKMLPIIDTDGSDSAMFDNVLELLVLRGPVAAARHHDDDPRAVGRPRDR